MADKEIKVHQGVIQMIFSMIQMAKYDRPARQWPFYFKGFGIFVILLTEI